MEREWLLHTADLSSNSGSAAKNHGNLSKKTALRFSLSSALTHPPSTRRDPHPDISTVSDYACEAKT